MNPPTVETIGQPGVLVAADKEDEHLRRQRCYKTLSLRIASGVDVPVLPTILVDQPLESADAVSARLGLPVMIRVDYTRLPRDKPLGGIPLTSLGVIERVASNLRTRGLYSLFQPHVDRFSNIYSAGVLITDDSVEAHVDIVGRGFDASDLRLGLATPHESLTCSLAQQQISSRQVIEREHYSLERQRRADRAVKLRKYAEYVNHGGYLLSSLRHFSCSDEERSIGAASLPSEYTAIPGEQLCSLIRLAHRIQSDALPKLPQSQTYVASFSLLPARGWILWDIYGDWYRR